MSSTEAVADPEVPVPAGVPVLEVHDLRVDSSTGDRILEGVSLTLGVGEVLGVVGESGSGKTTAALALMGYTQGGSRITNGTITVGGETIEAGRHRDVRKLRGRLVSYVPQSPGTALNPSMTISRSIREMIAAHQAGSASEGAVGGALEKVHLPGDQQFQRRYPHQLSGGQLQRVCISIALVCEPPLVILDEPTTGLDVVTQARILEELTRLRNELGISMIYIAHDLAVVAQIATRIAVMYAGRIVEEGPAQDILRRPRHPYTRGLLTSIPDHLRPQTLEPMSGVSVGVGERPQGCAFAPRCSLRIEACEEAVPDLQLVGTDRSARCIRADEVDAPRAAPRILERATRTRGEKLLSVTNLMAEHKSRSERVVAAQDVSFTIERGSCVALVGESGSGKTTIARTIVGLHPIAGGEVRLGDQLLEANCRKRSKDQRRRLQIVFQNPSDALNPRHSIRTIVARPAQLLRGLSQGDADIEVDRLLDLVRLQRRAADRYPAELSGGERQRIGIARALAAKPDIIVCDEITSALDVSVQAAVLELLRGLREELGLGMLFITHDLGVVASIADSVLVLEHGNVRESGSVQEVLDRPQHPYTQRLLESAPSISRALADWEAFELSKTRPGQVLGSGERR